MIAIVYFHFCLFSFSFAEWIEITKVVNKNSKGVAPKIVSSTPANYEAILVKPQHFLEIPSTTPAQENFTVSEKNVSSTTFTSLPATETFFKEKEVNYTIFKDKDEPIEMEERNDHPRDDLTEGYTSFESVLKRVRNNLLNYKGHSLRGKIKLLENIRDNMLYQIKTRMSKLWLEKRDEEEQLKPRGYKDDHEMDFPSNEGALMTIGFLTFAVFLIKLVLKLIYALKYKHQYYFPTTTTPASVFLKRDQRDTMEDQLKHTAKIMQYIEEYPLT